MAILEKTVLVFKCNACGYEWQRKKKRAKGKPRICPTCKSPKWNSEAQGFEQLMARADQPTLNQ